MSAFSSYWSKIFVINRDSRADRLSHVIEQSKRYGFDFERFLAHEGTPALFDSSNIFDGNRGCTSSHRGVLELIAHYGERQGWNRVLILEDDFEIVEPDGSKAFQHDVHALRQYPFNRQWEEIEPEIPKDWDMLYIGGQYGEDPKRRVSPHIIETNAMLTTSSYGVTPRVARMLCPHIFGHGPIDSLYGEWNRRLKCYCLQPRLMVQYTNLSDIQNRVMDNATCMMDPNHEKKFR